MAADPELTKLVLTELLKPLRPWGLAEYLGVGAVIGTVCAYLYVEANAIDWLVRSVRRVTGFASKKPEDSDGNGKAD